MENGISLEVISFNEIEDLVEVRFSCSNGRFSGQAEIYVSCEGLSKLAEVICGFPSHSGDSRYFELGTFNPEHADGGARLYFFCKDSAGHAVDDFARQLRGVEKVIGASACLRQAAP